MMTLIAIAAIAGPLMLATAALEKVWPQPHPSGDEQP